MPDECPQRLDVDWLARLRDGAEFQMSDRAKFRDGPAATADQDGFDGFRPRDQVAEMRLGFGDVDLATVQFLTNLLVGSCRACGGKVRVRYTVDECNGRGYPQVIASALPSISSDRRKLWVKAP